LFGVEAFGFQFQIWHFLFLWQAPQPTSLPNFLNCFLRDSELFVLPEGAATKLIGAFLCLLLHTSGTGKTLEDASNN
jgi:hypothetical protein